MYERKHPEAFIRSLAFAAVFMIFGAGQVIGQVPLGTAMPGQNVNLTAPDGSTTTLSAVKGSNATLVVFWSNRCPWIGKIDGRMKAFARNFAGSGSALILINSNDGNAFKDESIEGIREAASKMPAGVVYLSDADGALMKAMGASRTPEYYLFDGNDALVYTGSFDDSPGDAGKVTKEYLKDAHAAMSAGNAVTLGVTKPFGCMIKPKR